MNDGLKNYLHIRWINSNHSKYHMYFDEWVKNVTPTQIHYFKKDMIKSSD